jgi:hypothetical protein
MLKFPKPLQNNNYKLYNFFKTMILTLLFFGWCLTSLLVNGSIFDPIKNYLAVTSPFFYKLLSCIQCTGVWVGALIFYPLLLIDPEIFGSFPWIWVDFIFYPVIQSGVSVIIESIVIWLVKGSK